MPTKKKATAKKTPAWVAKALEQTIHELVETKEKLAAGEQALEAAQVLVQVQTDTITRHVPELVELKKQLAAAQAENGRHLAAIRELVDAKAKDNAADQAEIEYWMGEVNRLHYELIDIRREAAREDPSDDLQDIKLLQDLALRGGVA